MDKFDMKLETVRGTAVSGIKTEGFISENYERAELPAITLNLCSIRACMLWPHVEDCPACFGFGFTLTGVPISGSEAYDTAAESGEYKACPVCKGTPILSERMELYASPND